MHTKVEYAVRIDCTANGCEQPHTDDGEIVGGVRSDSFLPTKINSHVVTTVKRTVTYTEWEPA